MAIEAPVEKLAFVTMLNPSLTGRCDAMGVIDPDPETKSNGKMARRVTMPDASAERRLERPRASAGLVLLAVLLGTTCMNLRADSITIGGTINQSTQDGTGPAVNNPSLNAALDGASYTIDLSFAGSITSLGAYDLTGRSLIFSAADAGVLEDSFNVRRRLRSGRRPRLFDDRLRL
jgi:hypothetical protein